MTNTDQTTCEVCGMRWNAKPHETCPRCELAGERERNEKIRERLAREKMEITPRDYFAAAALTGLLAGESEGWHYKDHEERASEAFTLAAAMLEERAKVLP